MLDIRGRARLAVRRWGVRAIFVDYLQLVSHVGAQSRENEVGFVSRGLKAMSMELGVPVIAAAQVNRKSEDRSDNRPKMSDLRESGSIEQDADLVLFCTVLRITPRTKKLSPTRRTLSCTLRNTAPAPPARSTWSGVLG
jgi:replicative DNA helicase